MCTSRLNTYGLCYDSPMKKILSALTVFALLAGCASASTAAASQKATDAEPIKLMVATDLHYLSPSLTDHGERFQAVMAAGDSKVTEYSEEIVDTLIQKAEEEQPSALILSGDLTFNGELISLQELKEKFTSLEDAGIPVLVIPGNHDIDYPYAYGYDGANYYPVEDISQAEFTSLMGKFGYDDAAMSDPTSFSYCTHVTDTLWLLFLDANTEADPGGLTDQTLSFAEDVLKQAQEAGANVIPVTHQNVLSPSDLFSSGFVITNNNDLIKLFKKYNISLCLNGHAHLQHTSQEDGLTQIITESLSVYPLQYGILTVSGNEWHYENKELGIRREESEARFRANTLSQVDQVLDKTNATDEEKKAMEDFAVTANEEFFSGKQVTLTKDDPAYQLWVKYAPDSFWTSYLTSTIGDQKQ